MNSAAENVVLQSILLDVASKEFAKELNDKEEVTTSAYFQSSFNCMFSDAGIYYDGESNGSCGHY